MINFQQTCYHRRNLVRLENIFAILQLPSSPIAFDVTSRLGLFSLGGEVVPYNEFHMGI